MALLHTARHTPALRCVQLSEHDAKRVWQTGFDTWCRVLRQRLRAAQVRLCFLLLALSCTSHVFAAFTSIAGRLTAAAAADAACSVIATLLLPGCGYHACCPDPALLAVLEGLGRPAR